LKDHLINKIILLVGIIAVLGVASSSVIISSPASAQKGPEFIPGRYIVVLQDGVSPQDVIKDHGLVPNFVYDFAINGFAAPISPKVLNDLKQDPRVKYVEQDQKVFTFEQTNPTGIERVDAEPVDPSNLGSAVTIAILDTGIDLDHQDLNVVHNTNCARGGPFGGDCKDGGGDDGNGHGTHVAGTAAALNNNAGVVGVATGADLWAVKVLGNDGSGWMSWVIGGIDYVTKNADQVDVANMSLGCECSSSALDEAISNSVDAGITYVVAAGNSAKDASTFSPANHPDVITVSAIADSDGKCGGQGSDTKYGTDDTFASFSNFGSLIEIAAPGVDILSTWNDGGTHTISGTSMASPHVAGAAALLIVSDSSLTPALVREGLIANGVPQTQSCDTTKGDGDGGFSGDSDGVAEPLVYVGATSVGDPPQVTITNPADGATVSGTVNISADASDSDGSVVQVEFFVDNTSVGVDSDSSDGWSTSWDSATASEGTHSISAEAKDNDGNIASDSISITVDNVNDPPAVAITNPKNGDTVSGTITITADATDDGGVSQVEFFYDTTSIGVDSSGSDGWSMDWITTEVSDADYTIKATAIDSAGLTSSDSISVTVSNTTPTTATISSVDSIDYTTNGGKDGDKHLNILIHVTDDLLNDVSGASVSIELYRDGSLVGSATGTTGSTGNVGFTLKNASSGTYDTVIKGVIASGLTWDGITPPNSFTK